MLVIYDLDKTSLYCPIADFMDKFIPKNKFLKQLYYKLYPIAHILEMKFGLLKINDEIYNRAKIYKDEFNARQCVVTARHRSYSTKLHIKNVFRDIEMPCLCVAQGLTNLTKAEVIQGMIPIDPKEEIIMYDDNFNELMFMDALFKDQFTGLLVEYDGIKEKVTHAY